LKLSGEGIRAELVHSRDEVVALDPCNAERNAGLRGQSLEAYRGGFGVDAARVRHDSHALLDDSPEVASDHLDHVSRVPKGGVRVPGAREDPHRDLGEGLEENVVAAA
jgi:hypothetical protein